MITRKAALLWLPHEGSMPWNFSIGPEQITSWERRGLPALLTALKQWSNCGRTNASIPASIQDPAGSLFVTWLLHTQTSLYKHPSKSLEVFSTRGIVVMKAYTPALTAFEWSSLSKMSFKALQAFGQVTSADLQNVVQGWSEGCNCK